MKRITVLLACFILLLSLTSCATMHSSNNIVDQSEFIKCTDPDCEVCGGTGELVCTSCGGEKTEACSRCNGVGVIDCEPIILFDCIKGNVFVPSEDSYVPCTSCNGDDPNCFECSGDGKQDCTTCGGTGVVDCGRCTSGLVNCSKCKGSGILFHGTTVHYRFCLNCETRLDNNETTCTNCGMNAEVFVCNECGETFNTESEVCPSCGSGK